MEGKARLNKGRFIFGFAGLEIVILVVVVAVVGWFGYQQFFAKKAVTRPIPEVQTPVSVNLKWEHQAQFAGIYVAKEKGLYAQEGLDVTIVKGGPGAPSVPAVLSGEVDFGVAGADDVLVALSEGKSIKAIATIYQKSPVVYFSLKGSGIKTPQDFIGKRVGLREGTGTFYTYVAMMNNLGIDRSKVNEISAKVFGVGPLIEGEADVWPGFRTNEPILAQNLGHEVNLIKPEDYGVDIYADVLIVTQAMIDENPDLVRAFVKATLAGWEQALVNQEEAVNLTMRYADAEKTTTEHQVGMLEATAPLVKPAPGTKVGQMNFTKWNRTYELLRQYGVVKTDVEVNDAYTTEFLK